MLVAIAHQATEQYYELGYLNTSLSHKCEEDSHWSFTLFRNKVVNALRYGRRIFSLVEGKP